MIAGTDNQDEVITPAKRVWYRQTKFKLVVFIALFLTLALYLKPSFTAWQQGAIRISNNDIIVSTVEQGTLIRDVAVSGKVIAANAPQLYATESGQVNFIAKPGQAVKKGDLLVEVTSPELDSLVKQEQASLAQLKLDAARGELSDKETLLDLERSLDTAKVQLIAAQRESERADVSFKKQVMSQVDYAEIKDALLEAELFFKHAQKRVELSKERLEFERQNREYAIEKQSIALAELERRKLALNITSPVDGIVGNWLVANKDKVIANRALISVVDLSEYEAELSVPEFYADDLGLGLSVQIKIAGKQISGEIIAISPEIVANQIQVKASLEKETALQLRQNQRLNARIEFERKENTLKIQRGAFLGISGGRYIYRLNESNHAEQVPISTGVSSVDFIEVSGLNIGDRVIISDYENFAQATHLVIEE